MALIANDYISGAEFQVALAEEAADYVPLMVDALATWDIVNPPEVAYGVVRAYWMLRVLMFSEDGPIRTVRESLPIDLADVMVGGLSVDDYIASVFGIYAALNGIDRPSIVEGGRNVALYLPTVLGETGFPQEVMNRFVSAAGLSPEEHAAQVPRSASPADLEQLLSQPGFASQTIPVREHPLCQFGNGWFVCLDFHFLADLVVNGLYWQYLLRLNSFGRVHGDRFTELWGHLTESYVRQLLRHFYPASVLSPLAFEVAFPAGEADAVLDFGDHVLLFEVKGSLLRTDARCNQQRAAFEDDFRLKFVEDNEGLRLIRSGGHVPKGGYDVPNGQDSKWPASAPAVL